MAPGDRLGSLVLKEEGPRTPRRQRQWICQCDCGREVLKREDNLKKNKGLSCGVCYTPEFGSLKRVLPLTPAGRDLADVWFSWAIDRSKSWQRRWPGLEEEIESAAQYGLVIGVSKFDPTKSNNLELFLLRSILTTIRRSIRNELRRIMTPARLVFMWVAYTGEKIDPSLLKSDLHD